MKIKQIAYEMTKSYDYNNVKVGIVVDLDENDSEVDAMKRAREYVQRQIIADATPEWKLENARRAIENASKTNQQADDARKLMETMPYYIIETDYVGINQQQHIDAHEYAITKTPPRTNAGGEVKTRGWLGTTNDWSRWAHKDIREELRP